MSTSLIGQSLGKIQIRELLGRGGMATVYKGYQPDIDRYVAIKVLTPIPEMDAGFVERFKLEARTIARLQHPHILPLFDYGDDKGLLYLVTAYVSGGSLADRVLHGPMPLPTIARILREIASALDYAHRQGVIHRDIKPGNILLSDEGFALLADFGIVKLLEGTNTAANLTNPSGVVGTPAYMSPEQANGLEIDGRNDIYAMGVVVYEMITGQQPFKAETPVQLLLKHLMEPPPYIRDFNQEVPAALDIVLQRALAKDPDERYQTATAFSEAFTQAISGLGVDTITIKDETSPTLDKPSTESRRKAANATATEPAVKRLSINQTTTTVVMVAAAALALVLALVALITASQRNVAVEPTTAPTTVATVAAVVPTAVPAAPRFGLASFTTSSVLGDTLNLSVDDLDPLRAGTSYTAWLENTDDQSIMRLGTLDLNALGSGVLTFTEPDHMPLPAVYNRILLTAEREAGDAPSGDALYSGMVPVAVTTALRNILWASDDGIDGGSLLDGAIGEAQIAEQHSSLAASATNLGGLRQHAEHTINILLGTRDDLDRDGRGVNPGRGVGVTFFLDQIDQRLEMAGTDPDADISVQTQIEYVRVCLVNARNRMNEVIALERELLASPDIESVEAQRNRSTEIAAELIEGVDLNQNGTVELFEGECGLQQVGESGIVMGNLALQAAGDA
ncbi:MAG: serine/threonine protein kinase [Anaerolineae bacterium]|nr:serine/threonine protein kinase [Anaerolineae bacterium]